MDRFEEIKKKDILLGTSALKWKKDMYVTHADYDWLISKIERLEKNVEWLIKDYARYMKEQSVHYRKLNIKKAEEDLRETLKEAMDKK